MSESFAPCPSCRRHVRARDEGCPFCGALLDAEAQRRKVRAGVDPRLSRAAALVAAATLTVAACGDDGDGRGTEVPVYGAPVAGAGGSSSAAGQGGAGGSSAGFDGGSAGTIYGVPAGIGGSAGTGAAGEDAGDGGAAGDGVGAPGPIYGLAPPVGGWGGNG